MPVPVRHALELCDTSQSVAAAVCPFVREGLANQEAVLVVATMPHWIEIQQRCRDTGIAVDHARSAGWLVVRDAEEALAEFMYCDRPDWSRFAATAGEQVRSLVGRRGSLRVYGEAVDLLVRQNRLDAAERLEEFWNTLAERESLSVLCSYSAEHFGNPRDAAAFSRICRMHTHVHAAPDDILASFLLRTRAAC